MMHCRMIKLKESGIVDQWAYAHFPKGSCVAEPEQAKPMNVHDIAGAFMMLAIGLTLALTTLMLEFIFHSYSLLRNRNKATKYS